MDWDYYFSFGVPEEWSSKADGINPIGDEASEAIEDNPCLGDESE